MIAAMHVICHLPPAPQFCQIAGYFGQCISTTLGRTWGEDVAWQKSRRFKITRAGSPTGKLIPKKTKKNNKMRDICPAKVPLGVARLVRGIFTAVSVAAWWVTQALLPPLSFHNSHQPNATSPQLPVPLSLFLSVVQSNYDPGEHACRGLM